MSRVALYYLLPFGENNGHYRILVRTQVGLLKQRRILEGITNLFNSALRLLRKITRF